MNTSRPELRSAIMMTLEDARANQSSPADFGAVMAATASEHYGALHPPERVAEMLDELAAAAGILAYELDRDSA